MNPKKKKPKIPPSENATPLTSEGFIDFEKLPLRDNAEAEKAIKFISHLKQSHGTYYGKNFELLHFQEYLIREIFGRLNEDGSRAITSAVIELPRKQGKSTLISAAMLVALFTGGLRNEQLYSVATSSQQSQIIFDTMKNIILQSPALKKISKIHKTQKSITNTRTGSVFRSLSNSAESIHGSTPSFVCIDEAALLSHELIEAIETGTGSSATHSCVIYITTAQQNKESYYYQSVRSYALKVQSGEVEDKELLPFILSLPDQMAGSWENESIWFQLNPALGKFRSLDQMRGEYKKAKDSTAKAESFKRLYLNCWATNSSSSFFNIREWDECTSSIEIEDLKTLPVYVAIDLSTRIDLTAISLATVHPDTEELIILSWGFLPLDNLHESEVRDKLPYRRWSKEVHHSGIGKVLNTTKGNTIDQRELIKFVENLRDSLGFDIQEVTIDPWGASMLEQELQDSKFTVTHSRQGYKTFSPILGEWEALIKSRRIIHFGNKLLRHQVQNTTVQTDGVNFKPVKKNNASKKRIDLVIASLMASSRALFSPKKKEVRFTSVKSL